jgi:hypothetical protein
VHRDKFDDFGSHSAIASLPSVNIFVGARVLREYLLQTGSLTVALERYLGAVEADSSGYLQKVLLEHRRFRTILDGQSNSLMSTLTAPVEKKIEKASVASSFRYSFDVDEAVIDGNDGNDGNDGCDGCDGCEGSISLLTFFNLSFI